MGIIDFGMKNLTKVIMGTQQLWAKEKKKKLKEFKTKKMIEMALLESKNGEPHFEFLTEYLRVRKLETQPKNTISTCLWNS